MARLEMPQLLIEACDGDEELLAWVGTLRESWQRYLGEWVMEPKSEEARLRRAEQQAERLLQTMEAERELPPMLAKRLRGTAHAMEGWKRLSVSVRQTYLLTLFGTRSAAAREKQLAFIVEACVARGKSGRGFSREAKASNPTSIDDTD